jgi:hypothetical protein
MRVSLNLEKDELAHGLQQRFYICCKEETYLLEHTQLRAKLPPPKLPTPQDILEIIVHANDEEEIPPLESLLEDSHLSKSTTAATAAEETRSRCLSLDKDLRAHGNPSTQTTARIAEEPVLRYGETGVLMECLLQKLDIPQ